MSGSLHFLPGLRCLGLLSLATPGIGVSFILDALIEQNFIFPS